MKKISLFLLLLNALSLSSFAQAEVNSKDALYIMNVLASDSLKGRKPFSKEIDLAGDFIAQQFQDAGLQPFEGNDFRQRFSLMNAREKSLSATVSGKPLDSSHIVIIPSEKEITVNPANSYRHVHIGDRKAAMNYFSTMETSRENTIITVDPALAFNIARMKSREDRYLAHGGNKIFIEENIDPADLQLHAVFDVTELPLTNVVGILPGKKRKDEYVIFSAHYDHLGTRDNGTADSIYNGANDDASGTTALIMLAHYFAKQQNNERSIIFVAFTAEEIGGYGSQHFAEKIDPDKVVAMFNIEMIGTTSKWGARSGYITGYEKSDLGTILKRNLQGTAFQFYPDPYPEQQLFYRSDNAKLAVLGVPAHTISTSKMDAEPNYHQLTDEVQYIDIENMTEIIKAIGIGARSVINGTDTPTRITE